MEYYVIAADGSKYGPTSLETLNKWAAQGRVTAATIIERASDAVRGPASLLPGLVIPAGSAPAAPPSDAPPPTPPAGAAQPTPPPGAAPTTPSAPGAPAQPRNVQFKDVDVPASAAERQVPLTHGMSSTPPPSTSYGGYQRGQAYSYDRVPIDLTGKFNWGAFLLTWLWGVNHKAFVTLLTIGLWVVVFVVNFAVAGATAATGPSPTAGTPGAGGNPVQLIIGLCFWAAVLGLKIWYGAKGYDWAWRSARFEGPEQCKKCQAVWGWWGLGVWGFTCLCGGVLLFTVFAAFFAAIRGMAPH